MILFIELALQIMLIILVIIILKESHYLRMIIFYAAFSLLAALLYYLYNSPDVAMAELAIGCAFIPLIFIIAISKQREFVIIYNLNDGCFHDEFRENCKTEYELLVLFCLENKLTLKIHESSGLSLEGVFRPQNADVIVEKNDKIYVFKLKETNALTHQLMNLINDSEKIKIRWVEEHDGMD